MAEQEANLKVAEPTCPQCSAKLLLKDQLRPMGSDVALDEWECPRCMSGVYIDTTRTKKGQAES